jgi:hypothetical protein
MNGYWSRPYLTMVTPSRNDDYGGGMLKRLQFSLNILFEQIEKNQLESELVLVDYNPPRDRELLKDILIFPKKSEYLSVRVIVVPPEIHAMNPYSAHVNMNGAVATNIGFYRARGLFSILRSSDIIWSEEILSIIKKKNLDEMTKYRCIRCDISEEILNHPELSIEQKLEFCRSHITTKMIKMKYHVKGLPDLLLNSDGDFQLMSTESIKRLRGYWEQETINSPNCDGLLEFCAYAAGIKDRLLSDINIYKIGHAGSYRNRVLPSVIPFYRRVGKYIPSNFFGPLFIRIARMTRLTSLFYDNRVVYTHGIQQPSRNEYYDLCRSIINGERDYVLNDEDWGLNSEDLREYKVVRASWEKT